MAEKNEKPYRFTLDGVAHETKDQVEEGRDLLQKAGRNPASDYVLIELTRPGCRSVGLDEEVDLGEPGREEFRSFLSDRTFNFTLDERGYEWGSPTIGESDLRDISGTPSDLVLKLERTDEADLLIEPGSSVDLAARGAERIRTERKRYTIIVNAREETVTSDQVSYAQLVALAFQPVPTGTDVAFTITYSKGPASNPKGTLPEGESIHIKNRMIFVVTQTNRS